VSEARDILDQRLARGEIAEAEYRHLLSILDAGAPSGRRAPIAEPATPIPLPPATPPAAASKIPSWTGYVGGALIAVWGLWWWNKNPIDTGNLSASGSQIEFKATNSSSRDVDTLFWIEQNDLEMCNKVTVIKANSTHTIRFSCPSLKSGRLRLSHMPASKNTTKMRLSDRIN
jgi:hypothetical protein